jgi:hypothetical protein
MKGFAIISNPLKKSVLIRPISVICESISKIVSDGGRQTLIE